MHKQETAPPCPPLRCTQACRQQHLGLISKAGAIASPWLQALSPWRASSRVLGFKSRPQKCTPAYPGSPPSPPVLLVPRVAPRSHLAWRFALTRPAAGGCCGMATSLPQDGSTVKLKGLPFKATVEVSQRAHPRHAARHCRERPACRMQSVDRAGSLAPSACAHPQDILEFLHDFTLTGDSVFLTRHPDGRPNGEVRTQSTTSAQGPRSMRKRATGAERPRRESRSMHCCFRAQAFIVFECPAEARRATTKDRHEFSPKFGDRYVRAVAAHAGRRLLRWQHDMQHAWGMAHATHARDSNLHALIMARRCASTRRSSRICQICRRQRLSRRFRCRCGACALAANAVDLTAPPLLAAAVACSNSPQHRRDRMAACATAARNDLLLSGRLAPEQHRQQQH